VLPTLSFYTEQSRADGQKVGLRDRLKKNGFFSKKVRETHLSRIGKMGKFRASTIMEGLINRKICRSLQMIQGIGSQDSFLKRHPAGVKERPSARIKGLLSDRRVQR